MKKNWKIIVGVVFLVGGFGCIGSDAGAAIFGIVVGVVFTAWWILGRKKTSDKKFAVKHKITQQISPVEQTDTQATSRPAEQVTHTPVMHVAPKPAVQTNHKTEDIVRIPDKKAVKHKITQQIPPVEQTDTQATSRPAEQVTHTPVMHVAPKPAAQTKHKTEDIVRIPDKKDGAALAYRYSVPFVPSDLDAVLSAAKAERWYLSAKQVGKEIHLFSEETDLGVLTERAEMVSDWLRRRDPYLAILERVNSETGCTVMLVFYRDKQKYNAHREQTVVALTGYKSDEKQYTISILEAGEELEAEEDFEKEDRVFVSYIGDIIGSLPKKYALRFINEGASLIVFDHCDEDEDTFICKPFVKIYW